MAAEAARKAATASRRGAFGAAASKQGPSTSTVLDDVFGLSGGCQHGPGPGRYEPDGGIANRVAAGAHRPSPVSGGRVVSRADAAAEAGVPPRNGNQPAGPAQGFASASGRFGSSSHGAVLGPGAYLQQVRCRRVGGTVRSASHQECAQLLRLEGV
jgi:hypothetical protein